MAPINRNIKALLDRVAILESVVAEQGRKIQRLQKSNKASLRSTLQNRSRSARRSSRLILPEEPRNFPEDRNTAASSSGLESTGSIFWNSFEASLSRISSGGDIDLSAVLQVLRDEAFRYLKDWRPRRSEIVTYKRKLIRAILSPTHIHKFTNEQAIFTGGIHSVWPSIVAEVFPEATRNEQLRTSLIQWCVSTAKGAGCFGLFARAVVRAHRMNCRTCNFLA